MSTGRGPTALGPGSSLQLWPTPRGPRGLPEPWSPSHVSATSLWPALTREAVSVWTPRVRLGNTQAVVTPRTAGVGGNGELLCLSGSANPAKLKRRTQFRPEWMFLGT